MYKGSAKQTLALLSLLRWVCESVWLRVPELETAAACFLKLCACVECIRTIGHTKCFDKLHALQTEHQKAFVKQWGDYVRPKHHHRLHLPFQYRALNLCPTMWGTGKVSTETTRAYLRPTFNNGLLKNWVAALSPRGCCRALPCVTWKCGMKGHWPLQATAWTKLSLKAKFSRKRISPGWRSPPNAA